jgi:lysophospholipase L1-like esterase
MGRRRFLLALIVLIVVVACAGTWLLMRARANYAQALVTQGWPTNAPPLELRTTLPANGTNVLLLMGDSRIAAWEVPAASDWKVFNGGVGGMTTAQLAFHCRAMLERARPAVVVLQIGINDLKILGLKPSSREAVVGACLSNITTIVKECRASGAHVVLTTIWPAGEVPLKRRIVWSSAIPAGVAEANQQLERQFAGQPGITITNVFATASRGMSEKEIHGLYQDTLHFTPAAYARLSLVLTQTLSSLNTPGRNSTPPPR